jgi:PIN domain nuclease of toxin-antitoxin system
LRDETLIFVSVASLWEAAIKSRLGKLPVRTPVEKWPSLLGALDVPLLPIGEQHVFAPIGSEPVTRDPFDRLLLGVCAAENLELITRDSALAEHPLAWRDIPLVKK